MVRTRAVTIAGTGPARFQTAAARWKEAELFPRVLHCAIDAKPFPYHHLTAERTG